MKKRIRTMLLILVLGTAVGSVGLYADPGGPGNGPSGGNYVGGGGSGDPGVPLDGGTIGLLLAGFVGIKKAQESRLKIRTKGKKGLSFRSASDMPPTLFPFSCPES